MELGEKLRQARLEAGLSQRQLCADQITRNMLSQIEHGTARPSMGTLRYLAERLGKTVSYFLEETAVMSPNQAVMERSRRCFDTADYPGAMEALKDYQEPDPVYDREKRILWAAVCQELARSALAQGKIPYAQELLEKAEGRTAYFWEALERQRLLLLADISGQNVCARLPSLDRELLIRAEDALRAGETDRAKALLGAVESQSSPRWNYLQGRLYVLGKDYEQALPCLQKAEAVYPQALPLLEQCCRELGDFKSAYEYACKQR